MKQARTGQLRIVAGNWRSRLLQIADVEGLRPTSARIRETLFNWLGPRIHGAKCLDLCAGTGALGIEALSRGAARAVFVEPAQAAVQALQRNLVALDATGAEVFAADAQNFLNRIPVDEFDIVFLDPPFAADLHKELCRLLDERHWLAANARIYIELDKDQSDLQMPEGWRVLKNKTAGKVRYMLVTRAVEGIK